MSASSIPIKFNDGGVGGHVGSMGRTVQPRTFASILHSVRAPPTIDYLSLDVEGHEEQVMETFPFDTHRISVLTVERPPAKLAKQLLGHSLRYVCDSGAFGDELWAHVDVLARRPRLMASTETRTAQRKPDDGMSGRGTDGGKSFIVRRPRERRGSAVIWKTSWAPHHPALLECAYLLVRIHQVRAAVLVLLLKRCPSRSLTVSTVPRGP